MLAAYKDLAPPWKELLDFYQIQQDARIKYTQLRAQFDLPGLRPPLDDETSDDEDSRSRARSRPRIYARGRRAVLLDRVSLKSAGQQVALLTEDGHAGTVMFRVLARLAIPTNGRFCWTGTSSAPSRAPATPVSGSIGSPARLTQGTVAENLRLRLGGAAELSAPQQSREARVPRSTRSS